MPLKIKELPKSERPYEKLEKYGEKMLSNAELLAIIIKTGTKEENSIDIANRILLMSNSLKGLQNLSLTELENIKGIGKVKAIQLKSICELAKRMSKENDIMFQVKSPQDVAKIFFEEFKIEKQEIFKIIILNTKNYITKIIDFAKGKIDSINLDIKQILQEVIKQNADRIIIVHNHPSGDPTPSKADINFTKNLYKASEIVGVRLIDHIVIGFNKYESIFSRREFKDEII